MKMIELVKISRDLLKLMSENEVKTSDWMYIGLYEDYLNMRRLGLKYRYVISELSISYHTSKSSVERVLRRFNKDVK